MKLPLRYLAISRKGHYQNDADGQEVYYPGNPVFLIEDSDGGTMGYVYERALAEFILSAANKFKEFPVQEWVPSTPKSL